MKPTTNLCWCRGPGDDVPITKDGRKTLDINRVSTKDCITQVADEVPSIWERASVPTRRRHHVIEMARQLWAKGDNICKSGKSKRATIGAAAAAAMMPDQVWHPWYRSDDARPGLASSLSPASHQVRAMM